MHRRHGFRVVLWALALASTLLLGCDDDPAGPRTGSIIVAPNPGLAAAWVLTGPGGFSRAGVGAMDVIDLEPGGYSLAWGDVEGYLSPAPVTGTLTVGETLTFTGVYRRPASIAIDVQPDDLDVAWTLTGPDSYLLNGVGGSDVTGLAPGDYAIAWEAPEGWTGPTIATCSLGEGDAQSFSGTFVPAPLLTPDAAIERMRTAYANADLRLYADLLSPDFAWRGDHDGVWGRDADLAIVGRMFGGAAGDDGIVLTGIAVDLLEPQSAWTPVAENDPDFGAYVGCLRCWHEVGFNITTNDPRRSLRIRGPICFYVVDEGASAEASYHLLGAVDQTSGETLPDDVLGLFFDPVVFTQGTTYLNTDGESFRGYVVLLNASVATVAAYELGISCDATDLLVQDIAFPGGGLNVGGDFDHRVGYATPLAAPRSGAVLATLTMTLAAAHAVEISFGPGSLPSLPDVPLIVDGGGSWRLVPCRPYRDNGIVATLNGTVSLVDVLTWTEVKRLFEVPGRFAPVSQEVYGLVRQTTPSSLCRGPRSAR